MKVPWIGFFWVLQMRLGPAFSCGWRAPFVRRKMGAAFVRAGPVKSPFPGGGAARVGRGRTLRR